MLFHLLMRPANMVCDAFGLTDEHERGMVRMLVNMMLLSFAGVAVFLAGWRYLI